MHRVFLLGVPIDALSGAEAQAKLRAMLRDEGSKYVVTTNSEMLVASTKNPVFRAVLERSALNLPDSAGLLVMARIIGRQIPERIAGVDAACDLMRALPAEHPVFLLGASPGIAERAAAALRSVNPSLNIVGTFSGSPRPKDEEQILQTIRAVSPHLLLVAFGAPAQELWIAAHLPALPSVRLAIGVGGTFDFLAGKVRRAPRFLRSVGLEWVWRLCLEPRRLRRIINAVVVFPILVLLYGKESPPLLTPDAYRN